jgi:hypothetical protein
MASAIVALILTEHTDDVTGCAPALNLLYPTLSTIPGGDTLRRGAGPCGLHTPPVPAGAAI